MTRPVHRGRGGRPLGAAALTVLAVGVSCCVIGLALALGPMFGPVATAAGEPVDRSTRPLPSPSLGEPAPTADHDAVPPPAVAETHGSRAGSRDTRPVGEGGATEPEADEPRAKPRSIRIDRLGIDAPVDEVGTDGAGMLEVPSDPWRTGWFGGGTVPGADGPAVIVGHVDSVDGPGVFWGLDSLAHGEVIEVERVDGTVARFEVERIEQWAKDRFPTSRVYREAEGAELRLVTCGGDFDRRTHSYEDNIIVFASQVP